MFPAAVVVAMLFNSELFERSPLIMVFVDVEVPRSLSGWKLSADQRAVSNRSTICWFRVLAWFLSSNDHRFSCL